MHSQPNCSSAQVNAILEAVRLYTVPFTSRYDCVIEPNASTHGSLLAAALYRYSGRGSSAVSGSAWGLWSANFDGLIMNTVNYSLCLRLFRFHDKFTVGVQKEPYHLHETRRVRKIGSRCGYCDYSVFLRHEGVLQQTFSYLLRRISTTSYKIKHTHITHANIEVRTNTHFLLVKGAKRLQNISNYILYHYWLLNTQCLHICFFCLTRTEWQTLNRILGHHISFATLI